MTILFIYLSTRAGVLLFVFLVSGTVPGTQYTVHKYLLKKIDGKEMSLGLTLCAIFTTM